MRNGMKRFVAISGAVVVFSSLGAPPGARADETVPADTVIVVETEGNVEAIVTGRPIAKNEGAEGQDLGRWSNFAQPGDLSAVPPQPGRGGATALARTKRVFLSIGSVIGSVLYFPIKLVVGVGGAWVGGVAGALSGGDEETAAGIWNVTTDGDYFVSPDDLDGDEEFRLTGDHR